MSASFLFGKPSFLLSLRHLDEGFMLRPGFTSSTSEPLPDEQSDETGEDHENPRSQSFRKQIHRLYTVFADSKVPDFKLILGSTNRDDHSAASPFRSHHRRDQGSCQFGNQLSFHRSGSSSRLRAIEETSPYIGI
jgi:hypothetical protein